MKRIKTTGKRARTIKSTSKPAATITPVELATALGAEKVMPRNIRHLYGTFGLKDNPFKSLGGADRWAVKEFMLHVFWSGWSGLNDNGDDGRGHLVQRGKVTCDMGLETFPDPPPTDEEMQQVR